MKPAVHAAIISDTDSFFVPENKAIQPTIDDCETSTKENFGRTLSVPQRTSSTLFSTAAKSWTGCVTPSHGDPALYFPKAQTRQTTSDTPDQSLKPTTLALNDIGSSSQAAHHGRSIYTGKRSNNIISCDKLNAEFSSMNRTGTVAAKRGLPPPPRPNRPAQIRKSLLDAFSLSPRSIRRTKRTDMPESPNSQHFETRPDSGWSASDYGVATDQPDGNIRITPPEVAMIRVLMSPEDSPRGKPRILPLETFNRDNQLNRSNKRTSNVSLSDEKARKAIDDWIADDYSSAGPSRLSALASVVAGPALVNVIPPDLVHQRRTPARRSSDSVTSIVDYPLSARTYFTDHTFGVPYSPRHVRNPSSATSNGAVSRSTTRHYRSRQMSEDHMMLTTTPTLLFADSFPSAPIHVQASVNRARTQPGKSPLNVHITNGSAPGTWRRPSADDVFAHTRQRSVASDGPGARPLLLPSMRRIREEESGRRRN